MKKRGSGLQRRLFTCRLAHVAERHAVSGGTERFYNRFAYTFRPSCHKDSPGFVVGGCFPAIVWAGSVSLLAGFVFFVFLFQIIVCHDLIEYFR